MNLVQEETVWEPEDFFVEGGTLEPDAPSYVTRQADADLWRALLAGEYCNVLTARQMGKSSLMVRTRSRLQAEQGVRTVVIDLTAIGTEGIAPNEWYLGLMGQLKRQLGLAVDEVAWWSERSQMGAVQRFSDFLRQVVLEEIQQPVVIFIDEIDSTLALEFTDDFFAAIRAVYNARAKEPIYKRLTFVLLGVARPADLIKDRSRTPYNIGTSINVQDFSATEAKPLLAGLEAAYPGRAEAILERILYWTDGHPYLTQKVCAHLVLQEDWSAIGPEQVDPLVERLFLAEEARKENNLQFIQDRLRKSDERAEMLKVYAQALAGKAVPDDKRAPDKSQLKLAGLVKVTPAEELVVRNRIYRTVFDAAWVKENQPDWMRKQVAVAAVAVAVLAVLVAGYFFYQASTRTVDAQAALYTSGFEENSLSEVRLNNLAGLFRLEGYEDQARDLFFDLSEEDQTALFSGLSDPTAAEADVMTIIQGVYQDQRLGLEAIPLLRAMSAALPQSEEENADAYRLSQALGFWANGRAAAGSNDDPAAIEQFDRALSLNPDNPAILYDRGVAHIEIGDTGDIERAADDFEAVVNLDETRISSVEQTVNDTPDLFTFIGQNRAQYPALAAIFPTLTPMPTATSIDETPTPTITPSATSKPTQTPTPLIPVIDAAVVSVIDTNNQDTKEIMVEVQGENFTAEDETFEATLAGPTSINLTIDHQPSTSSSFSATTIISTSLVNSVVSENYRLVITNSNGQVDTSPIRPLNTPTPTPIPLPTFTPTPVDETSRLVSDSIARAAPLGSDKGGFILVNCSELSVDWYIEQPLSEYRQVAIVPPFNGSHCGVSQVEGLFADFEHDFSFTAEGVRFPFTFTGVQIPAGQVAKMEIAEFGPGNRITYRGIQILGELADLQGNP